MAIDGKELARRLRVAREGAGVTQDQAASTIGVSRPAVAQIEAGRRSVSGIELSGLAGLYGRDLRELLAEGGPSAAEVVAHFRMDELAGLPEVSAALDDCIRIGRETATLERLAGVDRGSAGLVRYELGHPPSLQAAMAQGARTASAERGRLGLGDGPVDDVIDLVEKSGARAALIDMPDGISGLMLADPEASPLVVANRAHHVHRRTFSLAHEYAHVVLDAASGGHVSRSEVAMTDLREVRANAFAAELLMPEAGVRRHLAQVGKAVDVAPLAQAFDEGGNRPQPRPAVAAPIRVHDLAVLAHAFGVSRAAMANRLRSLRIIDQVQADALREAEARTGRAVAKALGLREPAHGWERDRFRRSFARLVLEAHGRGAIDRARAEAYLRDEVGLDQGEVADLL